jgi:16S rRNA G966 N2-methylase RsmD
MKPKLMLIACVLTSITTMAFGQLDVRPRPLPLPPVTLDPPLLEYLSQQHRAVQLLREQELDHEQRLAVVEKAEANRMQKEIDNLTIGRPPKPSTKP